MRWRTRLMTAGVLLSLAISPSSQAATIYSTLKPGDTWDPFGYGYIARAQKLSRADSSLPPWWVPTVSDAWSFVSPATVTSDGVEVPLKKRGQVGDGARAVFFSGNEVTLELCSDNDGSPGEVLRRVTLVGQVPTHQSGRPVDVSNPSEGMPRLIRFSFESPLDLHEGATYWVVLRAGPNSYIAPFIACQAKPLPGKGKRQKDSDPWAEMTNVSPQWRDGIIENCPLAFRVTSP
jgi:hypothetical protein